MTQAPTKYERYLADYRELEANGAADGPQWLRRIREHARDRFSELGLPTARKGNEKWKYTNVNPIANAEFARPEEAPPAGLSISDLQKTTPWRKEWTNLVFVDGHYSDELSTRPSSNGVRVERMADAINSDGGLVERHLARYASVDDDGFIALNTAFIQDGAYVHIPEGESLESTVHLAFISTERDLPSVSHPRVLVVAGRESKATIVESYAGLPDARYFTNTVSEFVVEEGAELDHYRLQTESEQAYHVGVSRVHLSANSVFSSKAFQKSVGLGRYDLYVLLDGSGASCTLNGLYMTSGRQHVDNYINIDHAKPNTTSRLYYKGILDGQSRAVFGGTVLVRKDAQKTDAIQSDKNLLLSPEAEVDTKPALFIYADDVKCGHGATAGNIDEDTVFYMRSRGIDLKTASQLLIYGFASEIVDTVEDEHLHAYLQELFLESLPSYEFTF
jgi:Fe-S cluster assembly protein SufD